MKEQRNKGTKEQRNKGTKEQRNKGTKEQRNEGTKKKKSSSNWVWHNQVSGSSFYILMFDNLKEVCLKFLKGRKRQKKTSKVEIYKLILFP